MLIWMLGSMAGLALALLEGAGAVATVVLGGAVGGRCLRVAWVAAVVAIVAVAGAAVCAWLAGLMITSPPRVGAVGAGWVAALVAWEVLLARG